MPPPPKRPSPKELDKKIAAVRAALLGWTWEPAHAGKLAVQLARLDLISREDQGLAMAAVSGEIRASDYCGGYPPLKATEAGFGGCEMFAFAWDSEFFGRRMYFKFVLRNEKCGIVSLHENER
jgi:hypothetical protein